MDHDPVIRQHNLASNGRLGGMSRAIPSCASALIGRHVVPVQPARRAHGRRMSPANSPSGRKPSTWRSRPRGNGKRPPSSKLNAHDGQGSRAPTRRPSGGALCAGPGISGWPRRATLPWPCCAWPPKVASHMNSPPVSVLARFAPWRPSAELRRRRHQRWAAPLPVSQAGVVHSQATPLAPVRTRLTRQRQQRTVEPCATVSVIAPDLHGLTANT
jgi:hypothetical protein